MTNVVMMLHFSTSGGLKHNRSIVTDNILGEIFQLSGWLQGAFLLFLLHPNWMILTYLVLIHPSELVKLLYVLLERQV